MGKYNYMNLNQKMIRIRKKVPKLIRKRYSEDVTYAVSYTHLTLPTKLEV